MVVSGLPGAGKTTLSERLANDLGLVLVCRDRLSGLLRSALDAVAEGYPDRVVGVAVDRLVNEFVGWFLDANQGAVIDGNFNWVPQREALRRLIEERRPSCFEVRLWGQPEVLRSRFLDREGPSFLNPESRAILDEALSRPREYVLGDRFPRVEVDTTDLRALEDAHPELVDRVRQELLPGWTVQGGF